MKLLLMTPSSLILQPLMMVSWGMVEQLCSNSFVDVKASSLRYIPCNLRIIFLGLLKISSAITAHPMPSSVTTLRHKQVVLFKKSYACMLSKTFNVNHINSTRTIPNDEFKKLRNLLILFLTVPVLLLLYGYFVYNI
jgi:hypothetical protein